MPALVREGGGGGGGLVEELFESRRYTGGEVIVSTSSFHFRHKFRSNPHVTNPLRSMNARPKVKS